MQNKKEHRFSSRWGFILAAVGSAVGMANVWGFPNKLGSNGGGAFLLIYLFFIFIFSYIGLSAELTIGRHARTGTLGSYEVAFRSRSAKLEKFGKIIGWLPLIGTLCISIGYAVVIAYVFKALTASFTGTLMTVDAMTWFESFSLPSYSVIPYHVIIVVVTLLTLFMGANSIEKTNKIMIPVFFLVFVILAIRVAFLPGVLEGYLFIFVPRWEYLTDPLIWVWAMGQAFFSLSITGGCMATYGAYLSNDTDIVAMARKTAIFDTIAAMVAALVIIPACFSYRLDVSSGPSLLFVTLPTILQDIPFGNFFAVILYVAMICAGISSLQNMFESCAESFLYKFPKLNRKVVLALLCIISLGVGIHMESIARWGPWLDIISIYIIPIGATIGAISWFWVMKKDDLLQALNHGAHKKHGMLWYNLGRYLYVPMAIILCCVALFMKVSF